MANLWRVLALSWLGGIASPVLTGDMLPGELLRPSIVLARTTELEAVVEAFDLSPDDADSLAGKTGPGPAPDEA
jgi:hypothetical protein